jgi:hypothetical protein
MQSRFKKVQVFRMKGIQKKKNCISENNCRVRIRFMSLERKILKLFSCLVYAHTNFAVDMLETIDAPTDFLFQVCFSDEATFHASGVVNRYNCRIWGSQDPHATLELQRGSPKVNMWAGLMEDKLIGPFFFSEKSVTGRSYLDMLEL